MSSGEATSPSPASVGRQDVDSAPAASDWFTIAVAARSRRRGARELWDSTVEAVRLVRSAARRDFSISVVLYAFGAGLTVVQVLAAKWALDQVVDTGATRVVVDSAAVTAVVVLAAATGTATAIGVVANLRQRLVSELVIRRVWQAILDVTTRVDLATFERADFHDHLERVRISAMSRPASIAQGLLGLVGGTLASIGLIIALLTIQPLLVPPLLLRECRCG